MGWRFEVEAWVEGPRGWEWVNVYSGNSRVKRIWWSRHARTFSGCVRTIWRPR